MVNTKMKILEKDDLCWCGSNKRYEDCHMAFDLRINKQVKKLKALSPSRKMIKSEKDIEGIKEAAVINNGLLDMVQANIKAGISTEDIDNWCAKYLEEHNAKSADLGYMGYPKSICTAVNDVICHGIPSSKVILKEGDIINVDVTTEYKGYFADASRMFMIGEVSDNAKRLVEETKNCLEIGMAQIKPFYSQVRDIGIAIERYAKSKGYSVVMEYCGHGVGYKMHEDPYVLHYASYEPSVLLVPGMVITIEPMINEGTRHIRFKAGDDWTSYTKDGKLSAQWEHTILITETGYEILSK